MLVKLWLLSFLLAVAAALHYLNGSRDAVALWLLFAALGVYVALTFVWWGRLLLRHGPLHRGLRRTER